LAARQGKKKATIAVAHSILISAYYLLTRSEGYVDLGDDCRSPGAAWR
jgi:transposase